MLRYSAGKRDFKNRSAWEHALTAVLKPNVVDWVNSYNTTTTITMMNLQLNNKK